MGSKFEKQLHRLNQKEFERFENAWLQILTGDWDGLDIIPLKGEEKKYRLRVGKMRLQFFQNEQGQYIPTSYNKRSENTYKK